MFRERERIAHKLFVSDGWEQADSDTLLGCIGEDVRKIKEEEEGTIA